ncbi:MAG: hypothetical protein PVF73_13120, partial [Bacteroidales bacterium]
MTISDNIKRNIILAAILFSGLNTDFLKGQIKDIGLPFINNYPRELYNAGTQNWGISQDDIGRMYIANNTGILQFDGNNWNLYYLPNRSVVRSVAFFDGKI